MVLLYAVRCDGPVWLAPAVYTMNGQLTPKKRPVVVSTMPKKTEKIKTWTENK